MRDIVLCGCACRPLGSYLKGLAALRLVAEQADGEARAWWDGDTLALRSNLSEEDLLEFFLERYRPTPIVAPWNGGSGFYEKDRKIGIDAISESRDPRFAEYREAITIGREMEEIGAGKSEKKEDERRGAILRKCRNLLPDRAIEWLDASVGIAADGSRSFAPVLGTGGNEGRLDYTNNFMERLAGLLIAPDKKTHVKELLANALFGSPTDSLQDGAAGQYDPGRAGGANQGQCIEADVATNPWDFVLTMEGAVGWASGLYRRQGVSYGSFLCSPFTVRASTVGYGSSSADDDARAEIWTPIWRRPARWAELKVLLREGRASVDGKPARNGIEFAEAATSLGIDRGIDRFVRYSLLKRRGDSYVALPAGEFPAGYRSQTDLVREFQQLLGPIDRETLAPGCQPLRRAIDKAMYEVLLRGGKDGVTEMMARFGRLLHRMATTGRHVYFRPSLKATPWMEACGYDQRVEVRIAAAIASIWDADVGSMRGNLSAESRNFAWIGRNLAERMISVIQRRLQLSIAAEAKQNPFHGACRLHAGDATLFIEGSVDDDLIEDLIFAFTSLDWTGFRQLDADRSEILPVYAVLKYLFLPGAIDVNGEAKRLRSDPRIVSMLVAGDIERAAKLAIARLRIAGLRPIEISYRGGGDARRLAAALLIPVRTGRAFSSAILHEPEEATLAQGN